LHVAQQGLTIMQHRDPTRVFEPEIATLVSKAAVRIGYPGIGLAFIRMPWLKMWPSQRAIRVLLVKFAEDAEKCFLDRLVVGKPPLLPPKITEGEEVVEDNPEAKANAAAKRLDIWLIGFTETYKELRNDRHQFEPSVGSYSAVSRFYAAVGDVNAAIQLQTGVKGKLSNRSIRNIMLALVHQGKASEALKHEGDATGSIVQGLLAAHLALGDYNNALAVLKKIEYLDVYILDSHFGKPERMKHLKTIVKTLAREGPTKVPAEALAHVESFPNEEVLDGAGGTVEGKVVELEPADKIKEPEPGEKN